MYAMNKAQAMKAISEMDDDKFPMILDIWNASDVRDMAAERNCELTDDEVGEVLGSISRNYDSEYGVNNETIHRALIKVAGHKMELGEDEDEDEE